jgi:DNA replication protein DnaC
MNDQQTKGAQPPTSAPNLRRDTTRPETNEEHEARLTRHFKDMKELEEQKKERWRNEQEERERWLEEQRRRDEERRLQLIELQRQDRIAQIVKDGGPRYHPERVSLNNYQCHHKGQAQVLARIRELAGRLPEAIKQGECLLLIGTVGTGKDHLLASLLHLVTKEHGHSARWLTGQGFYEKLRNLMRNNHSDEHYLHQLTEADVLAFSDPVLASGGASEWELRQLFAIVDARYQKLRPTWVSLNAANEAEAKSLLTSAVFDRLRHGGHVLCLLWPSFRAQ